MNEDSVITIQNRGAPPRRRAILLFSGIGVFLVFAAIGSFALAVALERERAPSLAPAALPATAVIALSPDVSVKVADSEIFAVLEGTTSVGAGTEIRTSASAKALLLLESGALAVLKEDSHVVLTELGGGGSRTRLALLSGAIWSRVERVLAEGEYYEVQSGDFVTSVRGTEFEVAREGESVAVTVVESEVALEAIREGDTFGADTALRARITSGERIVLGAEAGEEADDLEARKEEIAAPELERLVREYAAIERELVRPAIERLQEETPERARARAGVLPDSPFYRIEQVIEEVATMTVRDDTALARRHLALAEKRLFEARTLAEGGDARSEEPLRAYQRALSDMLSASARSGDASVSELAARATLKHQETLDHVLELVPEEARFAALHARSVSAQGHHEAVSALASHDKDSALDIALESMKEALVSARDESAERNSTDTFDALRRFDSMARLASDIAEGTDPALRVRYAEEMRKSLATVESVSKLSEPLLPGIARSVDEVRSRSVRNQLASIASLAVDAPEAAAGAYARAADDYLARIVRGAGQEERQRGVAEAYESYAAFGRDMVALARSTDLEEENIRAIVDRATSHHRQALEAARELVSEEALPAVDRALQRTSEMRAEPPSARDVDPQEFKERTAALRAQEELDPREFDLPELPAIPPRAPVSPERTPPPAPVVPARPDAEPAPAPLLQEETSTAPSRGQMPPPQETVESGKGEGGERTPIEQTPDRVPGSVLPMQPVDPAPGRPGGE